jgi:hypothetical protein
VAQPWDLRALPEAADGDRPKAVAEGDCLAAGVQDDAGTTIDLERLTYVLGPNGAGKTAVLQALVQLFGVDRNLRRPARSQVPGIRSGQVALTYFPGGGHGECVDELNDAWVFVGRELLCAPG